jgi:hypothetical protein
MSFLDDPAHDGGSPDGKVYEVRIHLYGPAAARARICAWHRSQQTKELPGGELEITLWLNNLVDVEPDILEWGPNAVVISPPELRASVRRSIAEALKQYET